MGNSKPKIKDRRLLATSTIVGGTVASLAMCIPLCAITGMATLPLYVIGGSALATSAIWLFGKPKEPKRASKTQIVELESTVADLRERLESLEVMARYEATLAGGSLMEPAEKSAKTVAGGAAQERE